MDGALRKPWTVDDFLVWEERQALRYEFDGFDAVAMVGSSEAHGLIQVNIILAVGSRLNRPPCRIIGSDLKLRIGDRIRYPDAMVLGSPRVPGRVMVTDPVIVFEILGPGTAEIDLVQKSAEYRSLASVRRYVVLQQTDIAGFALVRKGDDWITQDLIGEAAILRLPEVGIEVPMADIYRDVIIPPQDDAPAP